MFFLIFGSYGLKKNVKKSGGPCACLSFVDYFLNIMKMRRFHIFNTFDHKNKLIIMLSNLILLRLDGVNQ